MGKIKDLAGKRFGRLVVVNFIRVNRKSHSTEWECLCDCGNRKIICNINLKQGHVISCGCFKSERLKEIKRKNNTYVLKDNYCIGFTANNTEFLFDLEDYELISQYCWNTSGKYISANNRKDNSPIYMHRLVLNFPNSDIDHINRNKFDNRKSNLRLCSQQENSFNQSLRLKSYSGIIGVCYDKQRKLWMSKIMVNGKNIFLGRFEDKTDSIIARLKAEKELCGEFAPQKHLFKEYGVT